MTIDLTTHEPLSGHDSPDTALVIDDYPYGFRLRCKIRYWLEEKPKHGVRLVSQTTNPKREGEFWNKPKASTYSEVGVMLRERATGHITWTGLHVWAGLDAIAAFEKLAAGHLSEQSERRLAIVRKLNEAQAAKRAEREAAEAQA